MKAYKVTVSGSYRTVDNDYIDYSGLTGFIPFNEQWKVEQAAIKRYAYMWLVDSGKFPKKAKSMREVYIDDMVETEHDFTFVGKNIIDLNFQELQDLAVCKDLTAIPTYKKTSLREAHNAAYEEYANKVLGRTVDRKAEGFNVTKQPPIKVSEEWVDNTLPDVPPPTNGSEYSLSELKKIAKDRKIPYGPNTGYDTLYKKLFAA